MASAAASSSSEQTPSAPATLAPTAAAAFALDDVLRAKSRLGSASPRVRLAVFHETLYPLIQAASAGSYARLFMFFFLFCPRRACAPCVFCARSGRVVGCSGSIGDGALFDGLKVRRRVDFCIFRVHLSVLLVFF